MPARRLRTPTGARHASTEESSTPSEHRASVCLFCTGLVGWIVDVAHVPSHWAGRLGAIQNDDTRIPRPLLPLLRTAIEPPPHRLHSRMHVPGSAVICTHESPIALLPFKEEDDARAEELARVDDALKEDEGLTHAVLWRWVSERATHRSSPHGPCEPSARVMGRARTYATDLPKWDSTLPEAASERDHRSPHIRIVSPAILGSLLHIVTRIRPVRHDPRILDTYDMTFCIQRTGALPRAALVAARPTNRSVDDVPLVSVLRRSPHPDGPTACLTLTHRTRQRISRHSPSPTSHDTSTSRDETICLSPFLSTRAPTDAITNRAWSSGRILKSFGLTAPRARPETIGLLSRGVHPPVIYAPRNAS
ncbi:hypothetical protein B0H14DRAFT_3517389 [Mycena olivaceomarginata]|nr:hypothetical protein B0H14DRAFT_3517389 [Mycena olivaceomarginata]